MTIETAAIRVEPVFKSRLSEVTLENVPFGKYFTDYMLEVDFENGVWQEPVIRPYQPLQIDPSNAALHYGQSIFEGIKAYRQPNGGVAIFRPYDNFKRFNVSAARMQMPEVPEEIFIHGMQQLIRLDSDWVPYGVDHSLYIRPFMFASENAIGVRPAAKFKFLILLSPTGPYYAAPMRIYVEETYTRAAPGGVGFAKTAGNYAAAMYATARAQEQGYQQVLWTDAISHKYVQEIGTMNVFFLIGNTIVTPNLDEGTILDGITRKSAITLFQDMGFAVEERVIAVDELVTAYQQGQLRELFGAGTAATISLIRELKYRDTVMHFDTDSWTVAPALLQKMNLIRYGQIEDSYGWMLPV